VATQRVPGTRFPDSILQIDGAPYRPYFQQVYLADLERSRPPVFVDAVGPGNFCYTDRTVAGYETFADLHALIERNYRQVAELEGTRVFVRADRLPQASLSLWSAGAK
jgi:hypothetical protein